MPKSADRFVHIYGPEHDFVIPVLPDEDIEKLRMRFGKNDRDDQGNVIIHDKATGEDIIATDVSLVIKPR